MIRFQFVDDTKKTYSVKRICDVLKLNRSSYYKWKRTAFTRKKRLLNDAILGARVKTVFTTHSGCYGALRVSECVGESRVGFGVAQHVGVLAGTR